MNKYLQHVKTDFPEDYEQIKNFPYPIAHGTKGVEITLHGTRTGNEPVEDTFMLTPQEWSQVVAAVKRSGYLKLLVKLDL